MIQGFLACRKHSERIVLLVKMMAKSGLPCFKAGAERTVKGLEKRLALNLTEVQVRAASARGGGGAGCSSGILLCTYGCVAPPPSPCVYCLSLFAADGVVAHLWELLSDSPALFLSPPSPGGADGAVAHLRQPRCVAHSTVRLLSAGYEWYPVA